MSNRGKNGMSGNRKLGCGTSNTLFSTEFHAKTPSLHPSRCCASTAGTIPPHES